MMSSSFLSELYSMAEVVLAVQYVYPPSVVIGVCRKPRRCLMVESLGQLPVYRWPLALVAWM